MSAPLRLLTASLACAVCLPLALAQESQSGEAQSRTFYRDPSPSSTAASEDVPLMPTEVTASSAAPWIFSSAASFDNGGIVTVPGASRSSAGSTTPTGAVDDSFPIRPIVISMIATFIAGIGWYAFRYYVEGGLPGAKL
jgi:hypothetical protein